jgi:tetratricopeptide (TPR) repeat protein
MEGSKFRPEGPDFSKETGAGGVRVPFKGESSSSNAPLPPGGQAAQPAPAVDPDATLVDYRVASDPDATLADHVDPDPEATLVDLDATLVDVPRAGKGRAPARRSGVFLSAAILEPGNVLGGRYEILALLGEGGMGAVYKARDREVDRFVAVKVIRPELAANPAILARFKQELLLAHQVTHKNVIRIYDISEAEGIKFITMEFIEGSDLRSLLLQEGKFFPDYCVDVIRQICLALEAAHGVGVIHRDLKPQNVMRDKSGRILVMDFGLARSIESEGMTQTGAMVGTMEYMSPEQAMGQELDQRSDIFSVGLIFYELLTGRMPYKADTALASLIKRSQERAIPVAELDPEIPTGLSDIVSKCLERDLNQRYHTVQEILADLDAWQGHKPISASYAGAAIPQPPSAHIPWKWVAAGALVVALGVGGYMFRSKVIPSATAPPTVKAPVASLAILPFVNASGDSSLDWLGASLADMLTTDVGHSSKLRTVSPDRLHDVMKDLHMARDAQPDPQSLKQLSEFVSAQTVVFGQYTKAGDKIRIDATLKDLKQGRTQTLSAEAASDKELLPAVDRLAEQVRQNLSLSGDVVKELQSQAFRPTSNSIEALKSYNEGLEFARQGNNLEAQKKFEAATQADPQFALAFARLAQTYSNLGYDNEADKYSRQAVDLAQQLPPGERYLIEAGNARISNNVQKGIEAYENLAKASPDDPDIQFALAQMYESASDYDKAREHYAKVLEQDPKYVDALLASGRVEIKAGKPAAGLTYLNRAYDLAVQLDNREAKAAILQAKGVAYRLMDKPEDAIRNYQDSMEIKQAIGDRRGIAVSLNEIAQAQVMMGQPDAALKSYTEALTIRREIGDKRGVGDTLNDLANLDLDRGKPDVALGLYKESLQIQRDLQDESNQGLALNNIGTAYLTKGQYQDALTYYEQARALRQKLDVPDDLAETVRNVAVANTKLGQYDQALADYLKALDIWRNSDNRRGMAMSSYDMGTVFSYQGRFGAALNARQEALKGFREAKDNSTWMATALVGYGEALAQAGRGDEAKASFEEAAALSRQINSPGAAAQVALAEGNAASFRGDFKSARGFYEEALQSASAAKDAEQLLLAHSALGFNDIQQGNAAASIASLRNLAQQAESQGMRFESLRCHLELADALLRTKAYPAARTELERTLTQSEKLGLRALQTRAEFLLGEDFRLSGNDPLAKDHYKKTLQLLDDIQKEAGSSPVLKRTDFAAMEENSRRWTN